LHKPVLTSEVVEAFSSVKDGIIIDGTLGGGGHAETLLTTYPTLRIIGIDQDSDAIARCKERLAKFSDRIQFFHTNYASCDEVIEKAQVARVDGILLDIGVSTFQLREAHRGFSFREDGPLDMRMDARAETNARDILATASQQELYEMIRDYGEDRKAWYIAEAIVCARSKSAIETTHALRDIIEGAVFTKSHERIHPATRTFQALRIVVNDELGALERGLDKAYACMGPAAIMSVISFHSLEDRIVKNRFRDWKQEKTVKVLTKKPIVASEEERENNPLSRSAKLRIAQRI